jgi:hypothetical membrane protein
MAIVEYNYGKIEMKNDSKKKLQTGSIAFILAGVVYLLCEAIAALAWSNPAYKYSYNYISDLGIPVVTRFMGRSINSPLYYVMNFGFFAHGVLFVIGYIMIINTIQNNKMQKYFVLTLAVIHGIGISMVGAFPGYDWWGEPYHGIGALLAIVTGNFTVLCGGLLARRLFTQKWFTILSIFLCATGIASFVMFIEQENNIYAAVYERLSVYTIMAWDIFFGIINIIKQNESGNRIS